MTQSFLSITTLIHHYNVYIIAEVVAVLDSAHALFVRATYLVCHRLISSWKSDLNTSLAALELLSGLARINIPEQGKEPVNNIVRHLTKCQSIIW